MPVTTISSFRKCAFIHSEYLGTGGENGKINIKKVKKGITMNFNINNKYHKFSQKLI